MDNASAIAQKDGSGDPWVPVKERLPLTSDFVMVTVRDDTGDSSYFFVSFGWYISGADCWIVDNEVCDVIAWQPLPKPFIPESDKKHCRGDISILSELRSRFSCFDETEEPYYRALSNAIQSLSGRSEHGV